MQNSCGWPGNDKMMIDYHDSEWGIPLHDDNRLYEFIVLDSFQAGLSWKTVLHKRENFRKTLDNFNPEKVAGYSEKKISDLMNDAGIIRNKLKISAAITNAKSFMKIKEEHGSFDRYIWQFTNGKTIINKWKVLSELPARSKESDAMSKDLFKHGFKFAGTTICYAFMQAAGMVNDHIVSCFRYEEINNRMEKL